jgi:hypothetical protein
VFDGLGAGTEVYSCSQPFIDEFIFSWVQDCSDAEPDCSTNDTDDCDVCAGGNADQDCAGECFGDAVVDCAGECNGDAELDECGECDGNNDCFNDVRNTLSVNSINDDGAGYVEVILGYSFEDDVYGFQFDLQSDSILTLTGAEGGACEDAGFMISTNESGRVIGFSLSGAYIEAGSGELLTLSGTYDEDWMGIDIQIYAVEDCDSDGNPSCDNDDPRMVLSGSQSSTA